MKTQQLIALMKQHSVEHRFEDGKLLVLDVVIGRNREDMSQWVDASNWTVADAKQWLGHWEAI